LVLVSLVMVRALSHVTGACQLLVECELTSAILGTMAALKSAATIQQYCLDILAKISLYHPSCTEKVCHSQIKYSGICPNGKLSLTAICLMQPVSFCPSAAHSLLKQSALNGHLSYMATNFWSLG
jgi:hypothetical protein